MTTFATASIAQGGPEVAEALQAQLRAQLKDAQPAFTMVFASPRHPLQTLLPRFCAAWPGLTLGVSSSGEFTESGDLKGSVTAVAVAGEFKAFAGVGRGLKTNPEQAVAEALAQLPQTTKGLPHRTVIMLVRPAGRAQRRDRGCRLEAAGPRRQAGGWRGR